MGEDHDARQEALIADRIREAGSTRSYPARSYIFHEGDHAGSVLLVESGLLRIDRTTSAGRIVLLDLASSQDLVGELGVIDNQPRSATASTVTDTTVRHVSADVFRSMLTSDAELQLSVLYRVVGRLRGLSNQFVETSTYDAPARIAARLLHLLEIQRSLGNCSTADDGTIDLRLPISQEELGQWSGLSREGAVKGLSTLRSIGVLETGRKRVTIHDLTRLEHQASL